jgi:hypothetical protein
VDPAADLLGAPVRVHDLRVGTVTGAFADSGLRGLIGLEVTGRGGSRWFLPLVAASWEEGVVRLGSALVLVETGDLEGYGRLGAVLIRDEEQLRALAEAARDPVDGAPRQPARVSPVVATGTSTG